MAVTRFKISSPTSDILEFVSAEANSAGKNFSSSVNIPLASNLATNAFVSTKFRPAGEVGSQAPSVPNKLRNLYSSAESPGHLGEGASGVVAPRTTLNNSNLPNHRDRKAASSPPRSSFDLNSSSSLLPRNGSLKWASKRRVRWKS